MNAKVAWTEGMQLKGSSGPHEVLLDSKAPLGKDSGMTPKELVAVGLCGCTAMDVVALMKKYKQPLEKFEVESDISSTEGGHPIKFKEVLMTFRATGAVDSAKLLEAVQLSQTKYCGVSAMISATVPLKYQIILNDQKIGEGQAHF